MFFIWARDVYCLQKYFNQQKKWKRIMWNYFFLCMQKLHEKHIGIILIHFLCSKRVIFNKFLKGVFAKNNRGYRLKAKNKRFWLLLILLLCCVCKKKIVKNDLYWRTWRPYKFRKLQYSYRKMINLISNKSYLDITT